MRTTAMGDATIRAMSADPTVLLLHNRYREPGGEERSVAEMADLLRARGHRVSQIERSSAEVIGTRARLKAGAAMVAGGLNPGEIVTTVEQTRADVVHAHNINPLLGPRALVAAREAGARVVMHLHNYRLFCAIAIAYRDGGLCTRCHGRNTFPGVRLRCRGGIAEAAAYAAGLALHQQKVLSAVDRFVVPSRAAADRLASFGLAGDRLEVLPNFLADSGFASASHAASGKYALFAGRLTEEKGVDTAIAAAKRGRVPLLVAGSGPDANRLKRLAAGAPVRFAGRLSPSALAEARRRAAFAVLPSRWDEPCPYAVIEAMASGLPVLVSDAGGLPEMAAGQRVLPARDTGEWSEAMAELWSGREMRRELGAAALDRAREQFGADPFYSGLMAIYKRARRLA
jgi:glycosyltransferase involved in cell wall biosynthesis